jgi:toxin ParE1/3/4
MKPIVRRAKADEDVQKAVEYLLLTAPEYTLAFVDALEQAYQHIQKHPQSGAPRYAHELDLPGLRFWHCKRFPYLVFYVELSTRIEIWRVLHGHQDIPEWLRIEEESA